jgi:hypothetical protein
MYAKNRSQTAITGTQQRAGLSLKRFCSAEMKQVCG